jgi:hypothetical protein
MTPEEKALEFLFFSNFAILPQGCEYCPPVIAPDAAGVGSTGDSGLTDD